MHIMTRVPVALSHATLELDASKKSADNVEARDKVVDLYYTTT